MVQGATLPREFAPAFPPVLEPDSYLQLQHLPFAFLFSHATRSRLPPTLTPLLD